MHLQTVNGNTGLVLGEESFIWLTFNHQSGHIVIGKGYNFGEQVLFTHTEGNSAVYNAMDQLRVRTKQPAAVTVYKGMQQL